MGILRTQSGKINFGKGEITKSAPEIAGAGRDRLRAARARHLQPAHRGRESARRLGRARRRQERHPERIFKLFPVLKSMMRRRGGDLSGGQQQQLAMGRALALDPKLLILDEPTEGIQPNIVSHIAEVLLELNRSEKLTILLVEQKLPFVRKVADRFAIMDPRPPRRRRPNQRAHRRRRQQVPHGLTRYGWELTATGARGATGAQSFF